MRALFIGLLGLWTISGCAEEAITFRAEQRSAPAAALPTRPRLDGGPRPASGGSPGAEPEAPPGMSPQREPEAAPDSPTEPAPEAGSTANAGAQSEPFVTEFDLAEPRSGSGGRRSTTDPRQGFVPSCDASVCTCRINAECPLERPLCDFLGYCVECLSSQDCLRKSPGLAVCDEGRCRGCASDQECPMGWECQQQTCIESCDDNRDCPPDWSCRSGACAPNPSQ